MKRIKCRMMNAERRMQNEVKKFATATDGEAV